MLISKDWLNDFVDCGDLSSAELEDLLTTKVAEVDAVREVAAPVAGARIAVINRLSGHPERESLQIVELGLGDAVVQVLSGAPNLETGAFVAYVPPGGFILSPAGEEQTLEERVIAGKVSRGVMASEVELGLSPDSSGVLLLAEFSAARPGQPLGELVGSPDVIIEIDNKSLTHRPDLWSHFGFAREISAILRRPLKWLAGGAVPDDWADDNEAGLRRLRELGEGAPGYQIQIAPETKSRRFSALEIRSVTAVPSPLWLRRRLGAVGAGVRNVLVDLSNYVMHDVGQPNHTYDADRLRGRVISVRFAGTDESFTGLDGIARVLSREDVVISDELGAIALGGVMGGAESAIAGGTTRVLLESANFDPVILRHTTKRHQLRTDASNRFEKSRSPYAVPLAIQRFTTLLRQLQPAATVHGTVTEAFPERPARVIVPISYGYVRSRLSPDIGDDRITDILTSLGFRLEDRETGTVEAQVPYERATRDIMIPDDLVEEVGRIYGYENIPELAPSIESVTVPVTELAELETTLRERLAGMGFAEVYNYSFMNAERAVELGYPVDRAVALLNPIDSTFDRIRTSLVPGMLGAVERNARYFESVYLFELGRGYEAGDSEEVTEGRVQNVIERRLLSLAYMSGGSESVDFSDISGLGGGREFFGLATALRRIVHIRSAGVDFKLRPMSDMPDGDSSFRTRSWMHPFRAAAVVVGEAVIGYLAEVQPGIIEAKERVCVAELDLETLLDATSGAALSFTAPRRFPASYFEMSIVAPAETYYEEIEALVRANLAGELLRQLEVFAVYKGAPLAPGEKSVSVRLSLGAPDRTLSAEELTAIQQQLMAGVHASKFSLRS